MSKTVRQHTGRREKLRRPTPRVRRGSTRRQVVLAAQKEG